MPTVDLRFMVYDADKIKKATGYMLELNAASKDRVVAHDKEGHAMKRAMTATERYNKLSIKLLKIRTKDAEQGHMTAKQLDDQFKRHQRILKATESTLKDYVQTDRVAITQEKRKQKLIADSTKATVKYNNETQKLRDKFDSMGAATRRYEQAQKDIKRAFGDSESEIKLSKIALAALTAEYKEFRNAHEAGGIINAGNQFARYGDQAYRAQQKIKRFRSVGLQQVGYQVNDFIVQVASGQNALVAFGQQGSQLAGIFGTKGALYGALIAAASAIANVAWGMWQAHTGVKQYEEALEKLPQTYDDLTAAQEILAPSLSGPWKAAAEAVRDYYSAVEEGKLGDIVETGEMLVNKKATMVQDLLERFRLGEDEDSIAEQIKTHLENSIPQSLANVRSRMSASSEADPAQSMAYSEAQQAAAGGRGVAQEGFMHHVLAQEEASILARKKMLGVVADEFLTLFDDRGMNDIGLDDTIGTVDDLAKRILDMRLKYSKMGEDAITAEIDALIEKLELEKYIDAHAQEINRMASAAAQQDFNDRKRWAEALAEQGRKGDKAREKYEKDRLRSQSKAFLLQQKQAAIRFKAGIAAAKKIADAQERAAEGGARVQERYEAKREAALTSLLKASGKIVEVRALESKLAADTAEKQVRDQYETLRLKNGQLQLTAKQSAEMEEQVRLARDAAESMITFKHGAEDAAKVLRDQAEDARKLASFLREAEASLSRFENFTTNLAKKQVVQEAIAKALAVGGDADTARLTGRVSGEVFDAAELRDQAIEDAKKVGGLEGQRLEDEANSLYKLAKRRAEDTAEIELNNKAKLDAMRGGGKTPKSALDILLKEERSMSLKLDQRRALIGLTDQEILLENTKYALMSKVQEQMATMNESEKAATLARIDGIAQEMAAREEQVKLMEEIEAQNKHIADTIANSFGSAMTSIVDGTKSVKDAFRSMARDIIAELYQIYVVKQITGMISGAIMGPTLAGGYSPGGKTYGSGANINAMQAANGGAFYGGNVIPFASGGVVSSPTNFGMSGGRTGLMGEAGPEAIMPLKRGADGKLGVQADGGAGDVVIHQNFNFAANGDESVKKLIAQAAPQIAQMTKSSIISDRRRGGQMKATFG